ncbi:hypothetical protein MNB_SM-5-597 [hydrothermal vent metagenome]|uniref:Uncharacterized protein n=1 Tax=hydrothermal vent metagenome TaxID=652676 RepID=A0A1W1CLX8_9ZZZZ
MEVLAVVLLFFTLVAVILLKIKDYLFKKKDNYNLKFELVDVDEDEPKRAPVTTQVSAKLSPELYKKLLCSGRVHEHPSEPQNQTSEV